MLDSFFHMVQTDKTAVLIEFVKQLPAIIAAGVAAMVSYLSFRQSKKNSTAIENTSQKTSNLAKKVDGMQDKLLAATEAKGRAEGALETAVHLSDLPNDLVDSKDKVE